MVLTYGNMSYLRMVLRWAALLLSTRSSNSSIVSSSFISSSAWLDFTEAGFAYSSSLKGNGKYLHLVACFSYETMIHAMTGGKNSVTMAKDTYLVDLGAVGRGRAHGVVSRGHRARRGTRCCRPRLPAHVRHVRVVLHGRRRT